MDGVAETECCGIVVPRSVYLVRRTANSDGFRDGALGGPGLWEMDTPPRSIHKGVVCRKGLPHLHGTGIIVEDRGQIQRLDVGLVQVQARAKVRMCVKNERELASRLSSEYHCLQDAEWPAGSGGESAYLAWQEPPVSTDGNIVVVLAGTDVCLRSAPHTAMASVRYH
ncbi:hypothetical protein E6O75_ATG04724 [Venturia nashicola]|uniref:Uncharacterized protein n=1 Tax=Venturia nashicola TaxID=86259 RepID=A0A4Z1PHL7_9PEZI|nr:hypothetical protein E6O75_ATG04724 [Venturia nashicola]